MPWAEHRAPIYPGEDFMVPPKSDDPRLAPFLARLRELGVIDAEGKMRRPGRLMRGCHRDQYLWRVEWEAAP